MGKIGSFFEVVLLAAAQFPALLHLPLFTVFAIILRGAHSLEAALASPAAHATRTHTQDHQRAAWGGNALGGVGCKPECFVTFVRFLFVVLECIHVVYFRFCSF